MGSSNIIKNAGIGVIALIVVGGAYIFLVSDKKTESPLLTANSPVTGGLTQDILNTSAAPQLGEVRDIVSILNQLKTISIDDGIFKDPAFMALTDFHREISPQPKGRSNPFLPGEGVKSGTPQSLPTGR
ncbi:MAG: hypothetical protein HZB09_01090 [Candidatus Yonathbacteria bacterium]|nr:hypothetical protein [Candidatus Yonathbacteria bacterium]